MFDSINFINIEFFFNLVPRFFSWLADLFSGGGFIDPFLAKLVSTFVSSLLFLGIFYAYYMKQLLHRDNRNQYNYLLDQVALNSKDDIRTQRWKDVLGHLDNSSINSWTIAIIEADKMLDEALSSVGAMGDSIGEKLKSMTTGDLPSLQLAWFAHKTRNRIAHEQGFVLTQKDAREAIKSYESALSDLGYL